MLISNAFAQAAPAAAQDPLSSITGILPLIFMFVVLWFLMIRPQMKRAKEHKALLEGLQKNDEVLTQGGIVGKVVSISDAYVTVEVAANTQIIVQKQAVGAVLPKGTIKSI
ncbi:MAG: preprotein translocase subunit YajC [Zoogloea sp.]|uniref:preprotein translocase subunit YajC n=1 Tax=Zoogloea sp. TaxID=49181 RepID=UPI00261605F9|nr:preprotein translocase subunit YajC [Zoogloea sp.]MDD3326430.1 preprotein translocase subunit YajC [Zoogloea sp.]